MKFVTKTNFLLAFLLSFSLNQLFTQTIGNPPDWNWVQGIGGSASDFAADIARNAQGDVFIVGTYNGTITLGNNTLTSAGLNEAFVARFNAAGTLQWVQTLKASLPQGEVAGQHIALDPSGNLVVSGWFRYADMIAGGNTYSSPAIQSLFVARFSPAGVFSWCTVVDPTPGDVQTSTGLLTDDQGATYCQTPNITYKISGVGTVAWEVFGYDYFSANLDWSGGKLYLAGVYQYDFSIDGTNLQTTGNGVFVCEVNPATGALSNARKVAESSGFSLMLNAFQVQSASEIYIAGNYYDAIESGACSFTAMNNSRNAFLMRLNASSCDWLLSQSNSQASSNSIQALEHDGAGTLWVAGEWFDLVKLGDKTLAGGTGFNLTFLAKVDAATGAVDKLFEHTRAGALTANSQAVSVAGGDGASAVWSVLDSDGTELSKTSFANDAGFGIVASLEVDNSGIYQSSLVSGKFTLGGQAFDAPQQALLIAKLNHAGTQLLWHHALPGVNTNYYTGAEGYLDKTNGKFYCLGTFGEDVTVNGKLIPFVDPGTGGFNYLLIKVDASGQLDWARPFYGDMNIDAVATDSEGNILLSGTFSDLLQLDNNFVNSNGDRDFFVAKLNPSGDVLWAHSGGGDDTEYSAMVGADAENNIYVASEALSLDIAFDNAPTLVTSEGEGNILLLKYNPDGGFSWAKIHGRVDNPSDEFSGFPNGFAVDAAGNAYMAGFSGRTAHIGNQSLASPYNLNQFYAKFDPAGDPLWATVVRTRRIGINFGEVEFDAQGNLYCASSFRDSIFFGNTSVVATGNTIARNGYYARFNGADGSLDWATFLSGSPDVNIFPTSMALFDANSLLVGGYVTDIMNFGNHTINTASATNGYIGLLGQDIIVSTRQPKPGVLELAVFPNPAQSFVNWKTPEQLPGAVQAALINSAGQTVWEGNFPENSAQGHIALTGLASGVYSLRLTQGNSQALRKVVVE